MKADRDEAPEWLTSRPSKGTNPKVVVAGMVGTVITLGVLALTGQAFMQPTVKSTAESRQQPKGTTITEANRAEPAPVKDWDRIVEEQARRDAISRQESEQANSSEAQSQGKPYLTIRTTYQEGLTTCSAHETFQSL